LPAMTSKVAFTTLGCRLNQAESDAMADDLLRGGLSPAAADEEPDVVVVNTCTVTREATKASRSAIRRAVRAHPAARVVVTGCYAVSDRAEVEAIPGVDEVVTNDDKDRFLDALGAAPTVAPLLQITPGPSARSAAPARVRANLKVQTGCDEWCTFCIIPTTRGPLRSRDPDELVAEARAMVDAGAREIVLTGVHLGKYAYDRGGGERDLVHLLRRLVAIEPLRRVRLSSILSRHLTDELVCFMASEEKMCTYLHVPLQSGDADILRTMHRPYAIDDYKRSVRRARDSIAGLALATDVIVGFPGETDEQFERTMEVVAEIGFSKLHVFRYSARPGTAASAMRDEVPLETKRDRSRALIALGNQIRSHWLDAHLGTTLGVLVEDLRYVDGAPVSSGQTSDLVRVWFEGSAALGRVAGIVGVRVRADGIEGRVAACDPQVRRG
jgi:threonylcarbamoyladenosine tRNA methylthiotransferase MtaB